MDEGDRPIDREDRPGTDRDPIERNEGAGGQGIDRNETDPHDPADTPESTDPTDPTDPTDASEPVDAPDSTDSTETTESTDRAGTVETVEPTGRDGVPGADPKESESLSHRFRHDKEGALMWVREMLTSVAVVLAIGLLLFGVSGVWPPMVAVESGSMEPNMEVGDLVFVTEPGRLAPDAADNDVGVVTHEDGRATDYRTFGSYGSVVIYRPPGRTASPIIHRAMFHVEEGENWYDRADERYHSAAGCAELRQCPAPHDGFITLGDNNGAYDQANGLAPPVRAEWVTGVARVRVPYLGYVRLIASGQAEVGDVLASTAMAESNGVGGHETTDEFDRTDERETVESPTVSGGGSIVSASA